MRVRGEGSRGWGSSGSHQRLCPETTTLHRRSEHLPECLRQEERRVPEAHAFHRRDTHLRALKKRVEKRVSRVRLRRLCTAQGRWPNCGLKSGLRAAVQHLPSQCSEVSVRRGRHKGERPPGLLEQARESRSRAPSHLSLILPTLSPSQILPVFPFFAFSPLTPNWMTMSASRPYTRVKVSGVTALQSAKARAKASSTTSRGRSSE